MEVAIFLYVQSIFQFNAFIVLSTEFEDLNKVHNLFLISSINWFVICNTPVDFPKMPGILRIP